MGRTLFKKKAKPPAQQTTQPPAQQTTQSPPQQTTQPTGAANQSAGVSAPVASAPNPSEMTKEAVKKRTPDLAKFYNAYELLPAVPTEGEGSQYTSDTIAKLTGSAVKPRTNSSALKLDPSDKTSISVKNTPKAENFVKKELTKQQKEDRQKDIKNKIIIEGPTKEIGKKILGVLGIIGAIVINIDIPGFISKGKEGIESQTDATKSQMWTGLLIQTFNNLSGALDRVNMVASELKELIEGTKVIPIIGSVLGILMNLWNLSKNAKDIVKLSKRASFLKSKQQNLKKARYDKIVAKENKTPAELEKEQKAQKQQSNNTSNQTGTTTNLDNIKSRQKIELEKAEAQRIKDRGTRKKDRKNELNNRLKGVTDWKEKRKIKKEIEDDRKVLREMRKAEREAKKREYKQEIKEEEVKLYAGEHSNESEMRMKGSFFKKRDENKHEDYKFNEDKIRADVYNTRTTKKGALEDEDMENEEIIANFRARRVLKERLRGQVVDVVGNGLSLTGDGISLVSQMIGIEVPVGAVLGYAGTGVSVANTLYNMAKEAVGNLDNTTQGKRYLDRSAEVNTILHKVKETKKMDDNLAVDEKGAKVMEFADKYRDTKKYMHAYGINIKEAYANDKTTKYHVIKYMMEAVAEN